MISNNSHNHAISENVFVNNVAWTGATTNYAVWPVQVVNPPPVAEDEFAWLRRRVNEITDLVAGL